MNPTIDRVCFLASAIDPKALLINTYNTTPKIDPIDYKLGYKQSKWVTRISFVSEIPKGGKGYWEEQGSEWFGGI
jgi:hypothetical protein